VFVFHDRLRQKSDTEGMGRQGCHADDSGQTDDRMNGRMMAAGSSMTWTHYSIRYEVTKG
jgi:hypothetical protein